MVERRPWWVQMLAAMIGVTIFVALYVVLLRLNLDVSKAAPRAERDHRDIIYLVIHVGVLLGAMVTGFGLGKWLNGLGFAYAVLFIVVLAVFMASIHVGSQALACREGRNDVVRHWEC